MSQRLDGPGIADARHGTRTPARRRKTRYAILALAAALLSALTAWAWYDSTIGVRTMQYRRLYFCSMAGVFAIAWQPAHPASLSGWFNRQRPLPPGPRPLLDSLQSNTTFVFADPSVVASPMLRYWWFLCPLIFVFAWSTWKCTRRHCPPGNCQSCGYDLTGNVSGVCPECAAAIPPAEQVTDMAT